MASDLVRVDWRPSDRKLREFGVALAVFALLLALWLRFRHGVAWGPLALTLGGVLVVVAAGWARPVVLRPLFVGLSLVTWPLGIAVSWVLMAVVYFGIVTPIGLLRRWLGGDPMQRGFDPSKTSYWEPKSETRDTRRYFRQY